MKILITGELHGGKSTALKIALSQISKESMAGFFTTPVIENEEKTGHQITLTCGDSFVFAHKNIENISSYGQFGVDLSVFNSAADKLKTDIQNKKWLVIDELGIMESVDSDFPGKIESIIRGHKNSLVVVQKRAFEFWLKVFSINTFDIIYM